MGAWDQGQSAAAPRIADLAKKLASPVLEEASAIRMMRLGADMAIHELQMELMGQKSISIAALSARFAQLRQSLDALVEK